MRVALVSSLFLASCAGSSPEPPKPAPPAPPDIASAVPVATTSSPMASAAETAAPAAPPEKVLPPAIQPLSPEEEKEAEKKCKPITNALAAAKKKQKGDADALLETVLASPPKQMPAADVGRCADLLRRGIAGYLQASIESEATVIMKRIAKEMIAAYGHAEPDPTGKIVHRLCRSTTAVPSDLKALKAGPYQSTEADWSSLGWTCLHFGTPGMAQRFQYQVKTDAAATSFAVIARGFSRDGSRIVELALPGALKGDAVELSPIGRRELAASE